jgi:hypothetical protein
MCCATCRVGVRKGTSAERRRRRRARYYAAHIRRQVGRCIGQSATREHRHTLQGVYVRVRTHSLDLCTQIHTTAVAGEFEVRKADEQRTVVLRISKQQNPVFGLLKRMYTDVMIDDCVTKVCRY